MRYNIAVVNNRVDKRDIEDSIEELLEYFNKQTPLEIDITVFDADDSTVVKEFKKNSAGKAIYGTENGKEISRKYVTEHDFHQVLYCYNKSDTGFESDDNQGITAWSFWNEFAVGIEYTEVPMGKGVSDSWEERAWIHETMHALVKRVRRAGRNITDHMDSTVVDGVVVEYYKNNEPYFPDGNHDRTLAELAPHWEVAASLDRNNLNKELTEKLAEAVAAAEKLKQEKEVVVEVPRGHMVEPNYFVLHHGGDARLLMIEEALRIYQNTHHKAFNVDLMAKYGYSQPDSGFPETPDLAYHRVAAPDGWRQTRKDNIHAYHASNRAVNKDSIAGCITGNMSIMTPGLQHEKNIVEMIRDVRAKNPSIVFKNLHRDFANKECAGTNITHEVLEDWWEGRMHFNKTVVVTKEDSSEKAAYTALLKVLVEHSKYLKIFLPAFNQVIKDKQK